MAKSAIVDREVRIQQVKKWMLEGLSMGQMMRRQKWGISTRTLDRYIRQVRDEWRAESDMSVEDLRAKKIAELEAQKRGLLAKFKGRPSGIMAIMAVEKLLISLQGLEKPVVKYVTTPEGQPLNLNVTHNIDYDKLSPEVLKELMNARTSEK